MAAALGLDATGIDGSPRAIDLARAKAAQRGIDVRFLLGDALDLGSFGETFDTVIDSGLFHVFDDDDRARYVDSLRAATAPGGRVYVLCFSDRMPGGIGPRKVGVVGKRELAAQLAPAVVEHRSRIERGELSLGVARPRAGKQRSVKPIRRRPDGAARPIPGSRAPRSRGRRRDGRRPPPPPRAARPLARESSADAAPQAGAGRRLLDAGSLSFLAWGHVARFRGPVTSRARDSRPRERPSPAAPCPAALRATESMRSAHRDRFPHPPRGLAADR